MRKIDIFNHIYPPAYYTRLMQIAPDYKDIGKRMRSIPMLADLDVRFRVMDTFEDYQQVLSLPTPPIENIVRGRRRAGSRARRQRRHGGAGRAVSGSFSRRSSPSLPLDDPDAAVREAIRAIDAARRARHPDVHERPRHADFGAGSTCRSSRRWRRAICRSGCIRIAAPTCPTTRRRIARSIEIWWTFGWPYETSAAMARLVFAGYFDRFPALKIITHHMGAMAPYFAGRVGPGWDQLGARTSDDDSRRVLRHAEEAAARLLQDVLRRHGAVRRLRRDGLRPRRSSAPTTCCSRPTRRSIRRKGPMYIRETIAIVDRLPITTDEREKIYWRNAVQLLRLRA